MIKVTIATVKVNNQTGVQLPEIVYKQGKYMPELTIKDPVLADKAIKMMAGSEIKGRYFEIKMFGQFEPAPHQGYKQVSFTGKNTFVVQNMEAKTKEAVDLYVQNEFALETIEGDYVSLIEQNKPEAVCLALAKDNRLNNITRRNDNKYSFRLPTESSYKAISLTLNLLAAAGLIDEDDRENDIKFLR